MIYWKLMKLFTIDVVGEEHEKKTIETERSLL
jgi:hypothetical protein